MVKIGISNPGSTDSVGKKPDGKNRLKAFQMFKNRVKSALIGIALGAGVACGLGACGSTPRETSLLPYPDIGLSRSYRQDGLSGEPDLQHPDAKPQIDSKPKQYPKEIIPNVAILDIPENDPYRFPNGNVNMEAVVQRFYQDYPDDFDILVTFDIGKHNGKYNGWTDGYIHRYMPSNVGLLGECATSVNPTCKGYPSRLRYMQQVRIDDALDYVTQVRMFVHEVGHNWIGGWGVLEKPECFKPWASSMVDFNINHWSLNLSAGPQSVMCYSNSNLQVQDNKDGTFTFLKTGNAARFNYVDLYAMGLMGETEISSKEMYAILNLSSCIKSNLPSTPGYNPNEPEWFMYYGSRKDVVLADFKQMLKDKGACEGKTYYTGDGSRILHPYDKGKELAKDFRVALVMIKFPGQEITNKKAREICQKVNYDFPNAWHDATFGLSTMHTHHSELTKNPDCKSLFPPELDK